MRKAIKRAAALCFATAILSFGMVGPTVSHAASLPLNMSPNGCSSYGLGPGPTNIVRSGSVIGTVRLYRDSCSGNIHAYIVVNTWFENVNACVQYADQSRSACTGLINTIGPMSTNSPELPYSPGNSQAFGFITNVSATTGTY